ncbi:ABC transporter permease [Methanospirillum lacunae]|uniref:Phosphate ABC transporter permease n=1 Tax=Methanospirillum lacunae TaxID=668570 RepID=A0A2V2MY49_9EURY|nr:ABC transporter permease [Methanospirillum lacunae]PWR72862.1 phosphate ABC transporter permease [Methanospirillum lacunae]
MNDHPHHRFIRPPGKGININVPELWAYRELLFYLAWREVKIRYKQTAMGAGWAVLQPLFTMIIFTLLFGRLAKMPSDGVPYPLFSFTGLILWIFFSNALSHASTSMVDNAQMLSKVYFPRIFFPAAPVISGLLDYFISLLVLFALMVIYGFAPSVGILLLPVILGGTILFAIGLGCILSSVCVKYRDVQFALPFFIQLAMFASPVIYPVSMVPDNLQWLLYLNPMTGLLDLHRSVLLGHMAPDLNGFIVAIGISILVFVLGVVYLKKTEYYFADLI